MAWFEKIRPHSAVLALAAAGSLAALSAIAQATDDAAPSRPPEGSRIINLPSTEVPGPGTLGVLFEHRFKERLGDGSWRDLFTLDGGARTSFGVSYSPLNDLELSLDRGSLEGDFELAAKYRFLRFAPARPFAVALRVGGNARTSDPNIEDPYSFFAQGIATLAIGSRVHLTAVPTYISNTPRFRDVFNVPVALSLAITRSVNLQGEFVPKNRDYGQTSYGWIVAVEKTVLRHRFSWTFGNMHATTVNQYAGSDELGGRLHRGNVYMGFNIVRQWKLK